MEVFDKIIGSQIAGLDATILENDSVCGERLLGTLYKNSTSRLIAINDHVNKTSISYSTGKKWDKSLFNSKWVDFNETKSKSNIKTYYMEWMANNTDNQWQNLDDYIIANLQNYRPVNDDNEFNLTGVISAFNFSDYSWVKTTYDDTYNWYNFSSNVFVDKTDDIFNERPYNVTRMVNVTVIQDPLSKLYLYTKIDSFLYININGEGDMGENNAGQLLEGNLSLDMTYNSSVELKLEDMIINDNRAPLIIENWFDNIPANPSWNISDNGLINASIYVDGVLYYSTSFRDKSTITVEIGDKWRTMKIIASDIYNNQTILTYKHTRKSLFLYSFIILIPILFNKKFRKYYRLLATKINYIKK